MAQDRDIHSKAEDRRLIYFYLGCAILFLILAFSSIYIASTRTAEPRDVLPSVPKVSASTKNKSYVRMPSMSFSVGNQYATQVEMDITLEVDSKDVDLIKGHMPEIMDRLNSFFPKVKFDQLDRPRAMFLLHKNMLWEINNVVKPVEVRDLLLKNLVIM